MSYMSPKLKLSEEALLLLFEAYGHNLKDPDFEVEEITVHKEATYDFLQSLSYIFKGLASNITGTHSPSVMFALAGITDETPQERNMEISANAGQFKVHITENEDGTVTIQAEVDHSLDIASTSGRFNREADPNQPESEDDAPGIEITDRDPGNSPGVS